MPHNNYIKLELSQNTPFVVEENWAETELSIDIYTGIVFKSNIRLTFHIVALNGLEVLTFNISIHI